MSKKLKIALIGYGKMGKMIAQIAEEKGHQVIARTSAGSGEDEWLKVREADVAIEFTRPDVAVENIRKCFEWNIPVVSGTTGWYEHLHTIRKECEHSKATLLTASNFSVGVNLFFHFNKVIASVMDKQPEYDVFMEEIHHTQKLDAPSGTAITIAEGILQNLSRKKQWVLAGKESDGSDLCIKAIREEDVPGTHSVIYSSPIDDIEIRHTAHSRAGFAGGAVLAAEWLAGKTGWYTMDDIFGF